MQLSPDQKYALDVLLSWYRQKDKKSYITLGGYAGTGKTTLISILRQQLHKKNNKLKVAFVSYTGKGARVLEGKISHSKSKYKQDYIGTIHSLFYSPIIDPETEEIIGWEGKDTIDIDLIIVDEASMVNQRIWQDMLSYSIPVLAVGDHGQLPPIEGEFNLMQQPDIKLEQIHRQAAGDPIIHVSQIARQTGQIPVGVFGKGVRKINRYDPDIYNELEDILQGYNSNTLILCGYNFTRIKLNQQIRQNKGIETEIPVIGDRVICLRNNHKKQIFNGMLGTINSISPETKDYYAKIEFDDGHFFQGIILAQQFNSKMVYNFSSKRKETLEADLFDYGYALTVHKAQGSEAKKVVLFEERFKQMTDEMWKKWLYTAVTRAQEELIIIGA